MLIHESRFRACAILFVFLGSAIGLPAVAADRPQRSAESDEGTYEVRVERGSAKERCTATVVRTKGAKRGEVWSGPLVNETAPMQLFVRDDGAFLVTLDEARRGGARNAIVVYGDKGQLLRHWLLPDVLHADDWKHVKRSKRAIEWLDGAEGRFEDNDSFVIALKWEREVVIDLKRLAIVDETRGSADVPAEFAALLGIDDVDNAEANADENVDEVVIASDEGAIADKAETPTEEATPVDPLTRLWETIIDDSEEALGAFASLPVHEGSDAVRETGVAVPLPDPANPVDYLNWLNLTSRVSDPEAIEQMRNAIETYVPFNGDRELLDEAIAGDPDALTAEEIVAWRAANQEAIQHFRDFSLFSYEGVPLYSEDGSMIGALLPQLSPLRNIAKAAVMEGRMLAAEGRTSEAVELYLDTMRAGGQTGRGSTLIENLVGEAIQNLVSDALLDVAADGATSGFDFADMADRLEFSMVPQRSVAEYMQYERAMMMDTIQRSFTYDEASDLHIPNLGHIQNVLGYTGQPDKAGPLATLQLATLNFGDTVSQANSAYDRMTERLAGAGPGGAMNQDDGLDDFLREEANPLVRGLVPALDRVAALRSRGESQRRGSLLLSNILAYEQQHGAPPTSLDVFAGREFVVDPLTGSQFQYVRTDDGFELVGGDLPPRGAAEADAPPTKRIWPRGD